MNEYGRRPRNENVAEAYLFQGKDVTVTFPKHKTSHRAAA